MQNKIDRLGSRSIFGLISIKVWSYQSFKTEMSTSLLAMA